MHILRPISNFRLRNINYINDAAETGKLVVMLGFDVSFSRQNYSTYSLRGWDRR